LKPSRLADGWLRGCGRGRATNAGALVRFGSKADIRTATGHVRFIPESGHVRCTSSCPLWAKSGHSAVRSDYFARFHTNSSVTPAGVRGFVNFISSAVMDEIMRRWLGAPTRFANVLVSTFA